MLVHIFFWRFLWAVLAGIIANAIYALLTG